MSNSCSAGQLYLFAPMLASQLVPRQQPNLRPPDWTQSHRNRTLCCSSSFDKQKMEKSFSIRPISIHDIPKLALIQQQCQLSLATNIEEELNKSFSRTATATDIVSIEPIGYIICWLIADELQVSLGLCSQLALMLPQYCCF